MMKLVARLSVFMVGLTFLATPVAASSADPDVRRAVARKLSTVSDVGVLLESARAKGE